MKRRGTGQWVTKDGKFLARRTGGSFRPWHDIYPLLLSTSWPRFLSLLLVSYFVANIGFAFLYLLCGPEALEGVGQGDFWHRFSGAFFFSVQTLATIGYGKITPHGLGANLIVTCEALLGMVLVAVGTGLVFARVSRPVARVAFCEQALITDIDGVRSLVLRVANERENQIVDARVAVTLTKNEQTAEGIWYRNIYDLKLERDWNSVFALSWAIVHPIVPGSPLEGVTLEQLKETDSMLVVSVSGTDDVMSQVIHARQTYLWNEIVWNGQFKDMIHFTETDGLTIDLAAISVIENPGRESDVIKG